MVWPFRRATGTRDIERPPRRIEPPREDQAELRLIEEVLSWLQTHASGVEVRPVVDKAQLVLGHAPRGAGGMDAGAIIKFKRAKIAGVDVYDPALRGTIDEMIRHFDRLQKWSFNGVVTSKYDEGRVDATT